MKKIILLVLSLFSFNCLAALDDLSYKSVFRNYYPSMFNVDIEEDDYPGKKLPKVGINENGKEYLALLHPAQTYKNSYDEDRYLVFIEKREISKLDMELIKGKWVKVDTSFYGFSNTCNACYSEIDLRIFKKLNNGQFELVSSSQRGYQSTSGYGVSNLDISDLKNKVRKVGQTTIGLFYTNSSFNHGVETTNLNLLVLDENQIKDFYIETIGSDDSGKYIDESPLSHTLTGTWKVKDNQSINGYYPIEIKFKGDTYDLSSRKIIDYNKLNTYSFNKQKNTFTLASSVDY